MNDDIEEGIDAGGGGFQHLEREIAEAFYRAGNTISSAHAVFPVRSKTTGKWFPILMFFDQDNKAFSYTFRLDDEKQVLSVFSLLFGCDKWCREMNGEDVK